MVPSVRVRRVDPGLGSLTLSLEYGNPRKSSSWSSHTPEPLPQSLNAAVFPVWVCRLAVCAKVLTNGVIAE